MSPSLSLDDITELAKSSSSTFDCRNLLTAQIRSPLSALFPRTHTHIYTRSNLPYLVRRVLRVRTVSCRPSGQSFVAKTLRLLAAHSHVLLLFHRKDGDARSLRAHPAPPGSLPLRSPSLAAAWRLLVQLCVRSYYNRSLRRTERNRVSGSAAARCWCFRSSATSVSLCVLQFAFKPKLTKLTKLIKVDKVDS